MKKLHYGIAALALAFLAGSCQRENLEPVAEGTTVTYTVQVPGALTTKAGETYGGAVNQLVYEVHRVLADETTQLLYQKKETITNGVVNLDIEFVKDQNFKVLFWAQKDGVYNTDGAIDLTEVKVPVRQAAGSEENYEAFYGTDDFTNGTSAASGKVTLTRAVSLLSIGTTQASLNVGDVDGNVGLNGASVTVKALPNTLNVMTGEATANADQTYPSATGSTFVVGTETYVYVAKNYVAFADAEKSTVDVELTITTDEGAINHSIPSVPLKRNFKTNIVGDLITASAKYNVTLSDNWSDETFDIILVNDALSLQEAINQSPDNQETEIKLEGDIDLNDLAALLGTLSTKAGSDPVSITVPAGKIITLNLNGFNLSGVDESTSSFGLITNKGDLSIVNDAEGKVSKILLKATNDREWNAYSSVISTQPGSTLTVGAGVEIEHLGGTSMSYAIDVLTNGRGTSAVAVIDGATVKSTYRAIRQFLNGTEAVNSLTVKAGSVIKSTNGNKSIWMQDPSANANTGSLVVEEGAELYGNVFLSVTAGSTEWPVSVSVAASALKGESVVETNSNVPGYSLENKDGVYTVEFHPVAMIGEKGYATLIDAVAAVQDGETITLVADETFTETNRTLYPGTTVYVGIYHYSDKSFTLDLNGKTIINQEGTVGECLFYFKNDGAKANVITLKNGTIDAGSAYNAINTSTTNGQKITLNVEDIELVGNNSNGAVCKIRGGAEFNVKAGTVITGEDNYVGIESYGATTNIYEGSKIYQNGTSSYVGSLVGVSGNGTVNVYGGEGTSAQGAFIAMTSGGTINISGGAWIANTDGTISNDNKGALIAQSANGAKSIINVTSGTFKGGYNCYGAAAGDAQINIKGGNFNADPSKYVAEGYVVKEDNNKYIVVEYKPAAKVGNTEYGSIDEAIAAWTNNTTLTLLSDVTLSDVVTLKSTEHHILDLGTYTMTAASGQNAIEITCEGRSSASYALTVNADATNPGGITATGKACIYYKKSGSTKDRPIILINNGVFTGSYSINSISNGNTNCPQIWINGGIFNSYMNLTKNLLKVSGGTFHATINCTGDQNAYRLISGGRFMGWQFMTADAPNKFAVSSTMSKDGSGNWIGTYDVGCYVDSEGYLVVGGPVITEFGDKFAAKATNATKWSSYLKYSSAAEHGLYYTDADMATTKHGAANVVLK